ncbi:Riboflavin synthase-like beta-barrel protein [Rutstroemia sp. NJR-2017a BBW]|nr:Riboflavin synthase-like beta-barrel protein [Rutstroemia sp. NJR-2017a BBW]
MRLRLSSTAVTIWPRPQKLLKALPYVQQRRIHPSRPRYTWRDDFKSTPERDARVEEYAKKVRFVSGKPPPPGQPHYYVSIWPFERAPSAEFDFITYAKDAEGAKTQRRVGRFWDIFFFVGGPLYYFYKTYSDEDDKVFDAPRFTPFAIVSREDVSPTSMILTVRPKAKWNRDPYAEYWKKGLWSVEFKQPLLQIARSYTPLPPTGNTIVVGDLRFLIRKEPTGEMSNYLFGLPVDGKVEIRGPHSEFDMPENVQNVVFLAGGTGIAPALQVVYTLLEARKTKAPKPRIHIIWANRKREECVGGGAYVPYSTGRTTEDSGVMVRQLQELQDKYPENLRVDYVVDEERTFIDQKMISRAIKPSTESQGDNDLAQSNSKLLFVSGPEGFINYFAGPKKWWNGKETQGKLGGILGRMGISDWSVFKL